MIRDKLLAVPLGSGAAAPGQHVPQHTRCGSKARAISTLRRFTAPVCPKFV